MLAVMWRAPEAGMQTGLRGQRRTSEGGTHVATTTTLPSRLRGSLQRRVREFALIARDPVLMISLLFCCLFLFIFVIFPLFKGTINGFFDKNSGAFSLKFFQRYFDSYYGPYNRWVFWNTLIMGVSTAVGGTILGFIFAYTMVRCPAALQALHPRAGAHPHRVSALCPCAELHSPLRSQWPDQP